MIKNLQNKMTRAQKEKATQLYLASFSAMLKNALDLDPEMKVMQLYSEVTEKLARSGFDMERLNELDGIKL